VQTPYQSGIGSTRTKSRYRQIMPYPTHHARPNEHANAEPGPSNLAPQPTRSRARPPKNPSGGLSEATADAENNKTITEEDAGRVSNFYCPHVPHVTERVSGVRRPGVPEAWGKCANGDPGIRKLSGSCAPGRGGGNVPPNAQPTNRPWVVSADPILYSRTP
jgi:hypothetical protein